MHRFGMCMQPTGRCRPYQRILACCDVTSPVSPSHCRRPCPYSRSLVGIASTKETGHLGKRGLVLVTEVINMSLEDWILEAHGPAALELSTATLAEAERLAARLIEVVEGMEGLGMVHRDLKVRQWPDMGDAVTHGCVCGIVGTCSCHMRAPPWPGSCNSGALAVHAYRLVPLHQRIQQPHACAHATPHDPQGCRIHMSSRLPLLCALLASPPLACRPTMCCSSWSTAAWSRC